MNAALRADADAIVAASIRAVLPEAAVNSALAGRRFPGDVYPVAVGKAAWRMAKAALACLPEPHRRGIVVTKYGHLMGELPNCECWEAGHPVPDENGFRATRAVLSLTERLGENDTVLFLLSGGASALFEQPLIPPEELIDITGQLLRCGADIGEINTLRKRLSRVKGGRFAQWCAPAKVYSVVLSDVLGDSLDCIASGPAVLDTSTCAQAEAVVQRYGLRLSAAARDCLKRETVKRLDNVETVVTGSVRALCSAAMAECRCLGYRPILLTESLCTEARDAGKWLAGLARAHAEDGEDIACIAGGETVVHVTGSGLGGRNQELALSAAIALDGLPGAAVFSVGSDGTDGPTDAAGGYADGETAGRIRSAGLDPGRLLRENDAYHALKAAGGLIKTGPTGTNVNDVSAVLIRRKHP